jgi:protein-L-isoaspartate O-methyltransferase
MTYTATYSPDDNKLRLYASARLDAETYARVAAAGFRYAPKQELFVAPMWTPSRADLLVELAGQIDDEDTSLCERADERAERFADYSDKRAADAKSAADGVARIADGIPLGQPILIGHHSEKRARKDAEKIERGMSRAVKMWETSEYWTDRAAGAMRHAKYKERPDVRARRIKGIEADKRKAERSLATTKTHIRVWSTLHDDEATSIRKSDGTPTTFIERALFIVGTSAPHSVANDLRAETITPEQAQARAIAAAERVAAHCTRWIQHYDNRLAYERAMLGEEPAKPAPEKGGACRCWTFRDGWSYIVKVNKVSVTVLDSWSNPNAFGGGDCFTRTIPFDKLAGIMSAAEVNEARTAGKIKDMIADSKGKVRGFYLLQSREQFDTTEEPVEPRESEPEEPVEPRESEAVAEEPAHDFAAMRRALKTPVQVVAAPQLFPTPRELARQVCELADIQPGHRILEPSAGTGDLVSAAIDRGLGLECGVRVVAVEINASLAQALSERRNRRLYANETNYEIRCADFLECNGNLGKFDRIVMNPPFANGADIKHIEHARTFLKPGGRLVAICANGPRQRERLQAIASEWIDLPAGSFKSQGTNVNTALVVLEAAE